MIVGVNEYAAGVGAADRAARDRPCRRAATASSARRAFAPNATPEAAAAGSRRVRDAARGTANLLLPMRDALRARCTIGEICDVLRDEWGMYDHERAPS